MRVLVSVRDLHPPKGGAERSLDALCNILSNLGHELVAVYAGRGRQTDGLKYTTHVVDVPENRLRRGSIEFRWWYLLRVLNRWKSMTSDILKRTNFHICITQLSFAPAVVEAAHTNQRAIPTVMFVRSYEHICPLNFVGSGPECHERCWNCVGLMDRIQYPWLRRYLERQRRAMEVAELLLANSNYMKSVLEDKGLDSKVVYPIIQLEDYLCGDKAEGGNGILFIKPYKAKGANIVLEIAKRMKGSQFIVVGGGEPRYIEAFKALSNVRYIPWVADMRGIYTRTRILLMPSIWPEPFGRAPVEAGINGIPTVALRSGGLPEAVGDGGVILDTTDIDVWVDTISKLITDENTYSRLSEKARAHAATFSSEHIFPIFRRIIREVGLEL